MKDFYILFGVGSSKYIVNYHNGDRYPDGSKFYHLAIFSNKKSLNKFCASLKKQGYIKSN